MLGVFLRCEGRVGARYMTNSRAKRMIAREEKAVTVMEMMSVMKWGRAGFLYNLGNMVIHLDTPKNTEAKSA